MNYILNLSVLTERERIRREETWETGTRLIADNSMLHKSAKFYSP